MSFHCVMNGLEVYYPCSRNCNLYGDCVTAFKAYRGKQLTNADCIRDMSDEELACWLCDLFDVSGCYNKCPGRDYCNGGDGEANGLITWLQQPAEDDKHGA